MQTVIKTVKCQSIALSTHFTCFHGNLHVYLESALQLSEFIMKVYLLGTVVHVNYSQIADLVASREHSVQAVVSVIFLQNKQKFKGSSQLCFSQVQGFHQINEQRNIAPPSPNPPFKKQKKISCCNTNIIKNVQPFRSVEKTSNLKTYIN